MFDAKSFLRVESLNTVRQGHCHSFGAQPGCPGHGELHIQNPPDKVHGRANHYDRRH